LAALPRKKLPLNPAAAAAGREVCSGSSSRRRRRRRRRRRKRGVSRGGLGTTAGSAHRNSSLRYSASASAVFRASSVSACAHVGG
jgi:hypothetical protein